MKRVLYFDGSMSRAFLVRRREDDDEEEDAGREAAGFSAGRLRPLAASVLSLVLLLWEFSWRSSSAMRDMRLDWLQVE